MENTKEKFAKLQTILVVQDENQRFRIYYTLKNSTSGSPACSFESLDEALEGVKELKYSFR